MSRPTLDTDGFCDTTTTKQTKPRKQPFESWDDLAHILDELHPDLTKQSARLSVMTSGFRTGTKGDVFTKTGT